MKQRTKNRIYRLSIAIAIIFTGIYLILSSLSDNILFYYPPSEIPLNKHNQTIRIGGLVKEGSIKKIDIETLSFTITDNKAEINVLYKGILPALFREKQGIVAKGIYNGHIFQAESLLAKHDEVYKPKNNLKT
jgi:cytochrome c-type biogenesis protein CcmE